MADDEVSELDRIDPQPQQVTLSTGLEVDLVRMRTRQFFRLLRVLTHGAGPAMMRAGLDFKAGEVLQETYLHLERPGLADCVKSPRQYLLTIATNIARMGFRRERRWMDLAELDTALGFVDEAPDPRFAFSDLAVQAGILERYRSL